MVPDILPVGSPRPKWLPIVEKIEYLLDGFGPRRLSDYAAYSPGNVSMPVWFTGTEGHLPH